MTRSQIAMWLAAPAVVLAVIGYRFHQQAEGQERKALPEANGPVRADVAVDALAPAAVPMRDAGPHDGLTRQAFHLIDDVVGRDALGHDVRLAVPACDGAACRFDLAATAVSVDEKALAGLVDRVNAELGLRGLGHVEPAGRVRRRGLASLTLVWTPPAQPGLTVEEHDRLSQEVLRAQRADAWAGGS